MKIIFTPDGNGRCVYDEAIDVSAIGNVSIARGSHVEPNQEGQWMADLHPVDGPILGPFKSRSEALAAEVAWLHEFWLQPHCN